MRCQCKTNQNKRCKLTANFAFANISLCYIHAKKLYNSQVSLIQSVYRGYICRKKLKTLFYPLPDEIKDIVLKHMREEYYITNYNKSINKILKKRVDNLFGNPYIYVNLTTLNINELRNKIVYYENIIDIYNLYTKYIYITEEIYDTRLVKLLHTLWDIFIAQSRWHNILDANGEYMDLQSDSYRIIYYKLKNALTKYKELYTKEYYRMLDRYNCVYRILY